MDKEIKNELAMEALRGMGEVDNKKNINTKTLGENKQNSLWHEIPMKLMGFEGKYYKKGFEFHVLPLSTQTIKMFSSMDTENPLQVINIMSDVIKNQIKTFDANGKEYVTTDVIYEYDKFIAFMMVARYTGTTNDLKAQLMCMDGHKSQEILRPEIMKFGDITEKAISLYNENLGLFEILVKKTNTKFTYRPISINNQLEIIKFHQDKMSDESYDDTFEKLGGFYFHLLETEPKLYKTVDDLYSKYLMDSSHIDNIKVMIDFNDNQTSFVPSRKVSLPCTHKGCSRLERIIVDIEGYRNIFIGDDITDEY